MNVFLFPQNKQVNITGLYKHEPSSLLQWHCTSRLSNTALGDLLDTKKKIT